MKQSSNKILLFLMAFTALIAMVSCSTSTSSVIEKQVYKLEKEEFVTDNQKIDKMSIEEINYSLVSLPIFYLTKQLSFMQSTDEAMKTSAKLASLYDPEKDSLKYNKLISEIRDRRIHRDVVVAALDSLSKHADTAVKVYEVKYRLKASTNTDTYNLQRTKFLYASDFSEAKVDISKMK